jgi:hypothetical protein
MPPEDDVSRLLASIHPQLQPGTYAFCSFGARSLPAGLTIRMLFR